MRAHLDSQANRPLLRCVGRVAFALAAGGAFAALSWNPNAAAPSADAKADSQEPLSETAVRLDIVTEDGVPLHLTDRPAWLRHEEQRFLVAEGQSGLREEDGWGLVQSGSRMMPWTVGIRGTASTAGSSVGAATPTISNREAKLVATTGVNSRGPP